MKVVEGRYHYLIYDIPDDQAAEVLSRMEAMAQEYHARTSAFSGRLDRKLPFMIFTNISDYRAAGGLPGSAGEFDGKKLMAVAGEKLTADTWHVIQHEGFHQFAAAVIGGDMPIWVNEGLAEYFGEAIYTGDNFVTGVIPAYRRDRIIGMMDEKQFKTVPQMMRMSHAAWNANLQINQLRPGVCDGHVSGARRWREISKRLQQLYGATQPRHAVAAGVGKYLRNRGGF